MHCIRAQTVPDSLIAAHFWPTSRDWQVRCSREVRDSTLDVATASLFPRTMSRSSPRLVRWMSSRSRWELLQNQTNTATASGRHVLSRNPGRTVTASGLCGAFLSRCNGCVFFPSEPSRAPTPEPCAGIRRVSEPSRAPTQEPGEMNRRVAVHSARGESPCPHSQRGSRTAESAFSTTILKGRRPHNRATKQGRRPENRAKQTVGKSDSTLLSCALVCRSLVAVALLGPGASGLLWLWFFSFPPWSGVQLLRGAGSEGGGVLQWAWHVRHFET